MIKISVIIPIYNVENYLDTCLESVINQSFKDIEIICINDGSTDNSLSILEKYAKKDKRIKIINQENKGLGATRNIGLNCAKGEYIYFVDSDDYISKDTLEKLYENAIFNDSDMVFSKIARFKEGEPIDYSNPGIDFENIFKSVDFNHFTFNYSDVKRYVLNVVYAAWIKLYNKDFLNQGKGFLFPENLAFEDVPFHVKTILCASKISYVPEFFYHYRFNSNSIVNTPSNGFDIFEICDEVESFLIENDYYEAFKNEFDLFKISNILAYLLSTNAEDYYQLAKSEFEKIHLSKEHLVYLRKLNRFKLVLSCDSLEEYKKELIDLEKEESLRMNRRNKSSVKKKG